MKYGIKSSSGFVEEVGGYEQAHKRLKELEKIGEWDYFYIIELTEEVTKMKEQIMWDALLKLQSAVMEFDSHLSKVRQEPFEHIEAGYHEKVVLPLRNLMAMADNLEAAMKDKYVAGLK